MNKLADNYTLSTGLVNYLLLFRQYLTNLTRGSTAFAMSRSNKTRSLTSLDPDRSMTGTKPLDSGPVHPWEFEYKREKHGDHHPYWPSKPKENEEFKSLSLRLAALPPASEKDADALENHEKELLLSQYQPFILQLCARCYRLFSPIWRLLRSQFKKSQIATQKGSILTTHFLTILESNGITLTKAELGAIVKNFRGIGMQDIVRFDEFLRVCMLMKDRASNSLAN